MNTPHRRNPRPSRSLRFAPANMSRTQAPSTGTTSPAASAFHGLNRHSTEVHCPNQRAPNEAALHSGGTSNCNTCEVALQKRMLSVPRRQLGNAFGPVDRHQWVPRANPSLGVSVMVRSVEVNQLAVLRHRLKPVSKPVRHKNGLRLVAGQNLGVPFEKCRRSATKIHRHIEYSS